MNKIYLASRYSKYKELQKIRTDLEKWCYTVTSRWINENHQIDGKGLSSKAKESERIRFAVEDMEDLSEADTIICFTEKPRSTNSRGGRHVEMGRAIGEVKVYIGILKKKNK